MTRSNDPTRGPLTDSIAQESVGKQQQRRSESADEGARPSADRVSADRDIDDAETRSDSFSAAARGTRTAVDEARDEARGRGRSTNDPRDASERRATNESRDAQTPDRLQPEQHATESRVAESKAHDNRMRNAPTPPAAADAAHYDNLHAGGWTPGEIAARAVAGLESIAVDPNGLTLVVGDTKQMSAIGTVRGSPQSRNITPSVDWQSDSPGVLHVTTGGLVTAVSAGTAVLTVSSGTRTATVSVIVSGPLAARP